MFSHSSCNATVTQGRHWMLAYLALLWPIIFFPISLSLPQSPWIPAESGWSRTFLWQGTETIPGDQQSLASQSVPQMWWLPIMTRLHTTAGVIGSWKADGSSQVMAASTRSLEVLPEPKLATIYQAMGLPKTTCSWSQNKTTNQKTSFNSHYTKPQIPVNPLTTTLGVFVSMVWRVTKPT